MKKLVLSGGVIIVFIFYGLHQRSEVANTVVIPPKNLVLSTASSSPTPAPTVPPTPDSSGYYATPAPTPTPTATPSGQYKNGTYTGSVADAYYGNIQVQATIKSGALVAVKFIQYPNDRDNSIRINTQAMPYLQQEAIQAQSAQVDIISGATDSSRAFIQSLSDALSQAS